MSTIDRSLNTTADSAWSSKNLVRFDFQDMSFALKQKRGKKKLSNVVITGDDWSSHGSQQAFIEESLDINYQSMHTCSR